MRGGERAVRVGGKSTDVAPLLYLHRVAIMGRCPNVNKPKLIYFLFMTLTPSEKGAGPIIPRKHASGATSITEPGDV